MVNDISEQPHCLAKEDSDDQYDGVVNSQQALLSESDDNSVEKQYRNHSEKHHHISGEPSPYLKPALTTEEVKMRCDKSYTDDGISNRRKYLAVAVLFFINLLNYMDRFTIAGVLLSIEQYFQVSHAFGGLLQSVFIISYMVVAPLFGFLGDRYNRKLIMLVGMIIWCGATVAASCIYDSEHFSILLVLRGVVGIGEASYSTIAPTLIADLFVKSKRTRMLAIFFFAIPVGSGLGYVVGAAAAEAGGSWHWALRVTPGLGLLTMILMMVIIPNPKRGGSEASAATIKEKNIDKNESSYIEDLSYVLKNKTFMFLTIGFTFMAFVSGSLTIWGPVALTYGQVVLGVLPPCVEQPCENARVSFIFGLITCVSGFMGVWMGAESAKKWKESGNKAADAHVCAIALIVSSVFLYGALQVMMVNISATWSLVFLGELSLCFTWTLVGDMTLYVTLPNKRSTAQSVQILTMHLFGDAGSPYLLGVMSDVLFAQMPDTYLSKFLSMQYAISMTVFVSVLGSGGFLAASLFLVRDKKKVDDFLSGRSKSSANSTSSNQSDSVEMEHVLSKSSNPYPDDRSAGDFCTDNDNLLDEATRQWDDDPLLEKTIKTKYRHGLTDISQKSYEDLLNSKESDL